MEKKRPIYRLYQGASELVKRDELNLCIALYYYLFKIFFNVSFLGWAKISKLSLLFVRAFTCTPMLNRAVSKYATSTNTN